ncbi:hypothetical protein [Amorphus sp. MBR-141]
MAWQFRRSLEVIILLFGLAGTLATVGYAYVDFSQPLNLRGDNIQVVTFAKSYIDGEGFRFNHFLGYPGAQDNAYFPTFDFAYKILLWITSFFTSDPFISYHALYLIGTSAIYLCAYIVFRSIDIRPLLAMIGGVVFVVSPFYASRILGHDFLSLYFSVPLGAALALQIGTVASDASPWTLFRRPFTFLAIVAVATGGLYYAFFTCMFCAVAGFLASVSQRRIGPVFASLAIAALVLPILVVSGYGTALPAVLSGEIQQVPRGAFEQLGIGLDPADAIGLLVPFHPFAGAVDQYRALMPHMLGSVGKFEWPGIMISAIIFASPLIAGSLALRPPGERNPGRHALVLVASLLIIFGFFYAVRGGIALYFNMLIIPTIRGTERIIEFLAFFGITIALVWAETALCARTRLVRILVPAFIVLGLVLSAWPYRGALAWKQQVILAGDLPRDIESLEEMLAAKDRAGVRAVLQLPIVSWPEVDAIGSFTPYSHQSAYILDRSASGTRWSYGSAVSQEAFRQVAAVVEHVDDGELSTAARGMGFDAILIEKTAYNASQLDALQRAVEAGLTPGCRVFDDLRRVLFVLSPPPNADLCLDSSSIFVRFGSRGNWPDFATTGWFSPDADGNWTSGPSSKLDIAVPPSRAGVARSIHFRAYPFLAPGLPVRTVSILIDGELVGEQVFDHSDWQDFKVLVPEHVTGGMREITLVQSDARSPAELGMSNDPRHIGLLVNQIEVRATALNGKSPGVTIEHDN